MPPTHTTIPSLATPMADHPQGGNHEGDQHQGANGSGGGGPNKPKGGPNGPNPAPGGGPGRGFFGILAILTVGLLLFMLFSANQRGEPVTWQEFSEAYRQNQIIPESVEAKDNVIRAETREGFLGAEPDQRTWIQFKFSQTNSRYHIQQLNELTNGRYKEKPTPNWVNAFFFFIPFLLIILFFWFIISRGLRSAAGGGGMLGNFGKSRHKTLSKEMTGVTFSDVAGIEEAKEEVTEIIEFLKNPKKFTKLGGRIPRGVLLIGEPGCGKTLLAKAIAGEADVPFFSISGSDFVEMFVGVGASRVRDLFKQAKESAPCIIFLDEIDAVGRRRGGGFTTGGHDEREQTLNAILVEMDGFGSGDGVIVVAATNRADVLDPALIRPGRFDRQIVVPLPDVKGRLEILKVHAKKVTLSPDVDLERVAKVTPMFSGADLAAIINEAAISATMHNKDVIEHEDLEEARDKVKFGRAKKSRVREEDDNKLTAYHEAGHAILQALLKDADPLHKVTIIPRGQMGGATFSLPDRDRMGVSLRWLEATMRMACGGRIAEEKAMNDVSSGAVSDIAQVTNMARSMVIEWGMSPRLGFIRYAGADTRESFMPERDYSDDTAKAIDEEIRRIVDEAYQEAARLLDEHWDKVEALAGALIKYETLSGDDVDKIMRGEPLGKPSVADLLKTQAAETAPAATASKPDPEPDPEGELPPGAMPSPA
ncbi:MAG: ATP-dependent zinc metalloprotease FtsH [Planctomycetota bacterium]